MRAHRGFTLLELMMVVVIVGILAALATGAYYSYVVRSQLAQTLTDYDHIRNVVHIETAADGRTDLQTGSMPGEVPPALVSLLNRREFNQIDGMTLQLVKAPAGTFAGYPNDDAYALIAATDSETGQYRLRVLRELLPHSEGDKIWLSQGMLYFPLDLNPGGSVAPSPPGTSPPTPTPSVPVTPVPPIGGGKTTGWGNAQATNQGSTWNAQARICIAGSDGQLLSGDINAQVQIRVVQEVKTWNGESTERSWLTQVPLVNGCADFSQSGSPQAGPGTEGVTGIRFEVVNVIYYWPTDPPVKWDGGQPVQHIDAPS